MPKVSSKKKLKVGKRYDSWSRYYDAIDNFPLVSRPQKRWRKRAIELLDAREDSAIVDLGTGSGLILPWIARSVLEGLVIGVDLSRKMLLRARTRGREWANINLLMVECGSLPLMTNSVDGVIATYAFTSIPNWRESILEGLRILKKGGRFVVLDTGRPTKSWIRIFHAPIAAVARLFGYTNMHLDIQGFMDKIPGIKKVEEERYYGTMVYIAVYEKVGKKQNKMKK